MHVTHNECLPKSRNQGGTAELKLRPYFGMKFFYAQFFVHFTEKENDAL